PDERRATAAAHQEKSIALIDLREVHWNISIALREWIPARGNGGLHDVDFPPPKHFVQASLGRLLEIHAPQALVLQETPGNGRNERAVKHGVPVHHDADLIVNSCRHALPERAEADLKRSVGLLLEEVLWKISSREPPWLPAFGSYASARASHAEPH